ncbi:hypothetical protein [Rhizobium sp. MHM7A]|uniref:hypothetical protein n=1 Tax=Rhizobium sp. MHM7A TaxID=2583233 RepID=UPI001105E43F|nr:hypothetical protein [Rhizobium sp. MHM7A]TLX17098.1 hypothetical protein FFR93_07225 [Rhizobium sp. MHM7A]
MDENEIEEAVNAGTVLLHGCSLENVANIIVDNRLRNDIRDHGGPLGVSLTRSLAIAESFGKASEEDFSEILYDWYELKTGLAAQTRKGAILVFKRSDLTDLALVEYDDFEGSGPNEQEERVLGQINNAFRRLSSILVDRAEYDWFRSVVDQHFRAMNEPADKLLAALTKAESKIVFKDEPVLALAM